jgi:16S rRNA (cytidine1402-2'-O)-methyltransferase
LTDARRPPPALTVVATPIGNLRDITLRALDALRECDEVLAEDTRNTLALLRAHAIERPVTRFDDHVARERCDALVERMKEGRRYALVSDAGTPLVSDPGALLVARCAEAGLVVEARPGPSAVLAALVMSGLGGGGFRFVGFVPREGTERRTVLAAMARDPLATVFFESAERTADTLAALGALCDASRRAVVTRELTKLHEACYRGTVGSLAAELAAQGPRGEVTVVLEGAAELADAGDALDAAIAAALASGMRPSDAAREVARALGLKRSEVYARVLAKGEREGG